MRVWENSANSNYNSLQLSLKKQATHGMTFNVNYTYSHSIDDGSTWHSGATSSNGPGAGEGYTTDVTQPGLDRGNSIFDIRHRLVGNYVYEFPFFKSQNGILGHILGGWSNVGVVSWQSGAHWEPFRATSAKLQNITDPANPTACTAADVTNNVCTNVGGDYNLDGVNNDRPNSSVAGFSGATHDQWAQGFFNAAQPANITFSAPCLGCIGDLGRNTFVGPSFVGWDTSLHKKIKVTERVNMEFRAEAFNTLNHTNFQLPGAHNATNNRITSANFGQAGSTFNPRQMQLGLKVSF